MRVVVLDALRDGPKYYAAIVGLVAAKCPEITPEAPHKREGQAITKLKVCGAMAHDDKR
jgi:hypothetical protein